MLLVLKNVKMSICVLIRKVDSKDLIATLKNYTTIPVKVDHTLFDKENYDWIYFLEHLNEDKCLSKLANTK